MTAQNPPAWLADAGVSHNADDIRRLFATLFFDAEGPFESDGMEVTQKGGGADMSVDVATGRCIVKGTEATYQGSYFCQNQGVTNLSVTAADLSNPRIDIVVAQVRDSSYSGGDDDWQLAIVDGTAAASPVAPATPANSYVLAEILVPASASSIVDGDITDERTRYLTNAIEDFMLATGIDGSKITGTVANATTAASATTATTATTAGRWTTSRTLTVTGDMTGSVAFDGSGAIALTLSAALEAADIPNLDAGKVTSGTFSTSRIPDLNASKIDAGTFGAGDYRFPSDVSIDERLSVGRTSVDTSRGLYVDSGTNGNEIERDTNDSGEGILVLTGTSGSKFIFYGDGNAAKSGGAGDWDAISDDRLKNKLSSLWPADVLRRMAQLDPTMYEHTHTVTYVEDEDTPADLRIVELDGPADPLAGFMASDFEKQFPDLVHVQGSDRIRHLPIGQYDAYLTAAIIALAEFVGFE